MSDIMDKAVLTMPYELAMGDELSSMQFWSRVQLFYKEQSARTKADEALMRQALEALEWVVDQAGGPACEHEGSVCFCKENKAINALRARLESSNAS